MKSLFLLILSMLAVGSSDSIHMLYKHFLSKVTEKSLNAFYYVCSYAKIDCSKFMNVTARLALQIIPEHLCNEPVFLCVDDTMIAKFGKKFENVSKLFDHAAHNGSNYLNGHCFVSLMLCVPVWKNNRIVYHSVPLMACAWQEKAPLNQTSREWMQYVPLFAYSFRWKIEISYYEQKTFWPLCSYMVRSKKGIETIINLINISYCAMKILPYKDETFSQYKDTSVQEFRFALSQQINQQIIFATFIKNVETTIKSNTLVKAVKLALLSFGYHG